MPFILDKWLYHVSEWATYPQIGQECKYLPKSPRPVGSEAAMKWPAQHGVHEPMNTMNFEESNLC